MLVLPDVRLMFHSPFSFTSADRLSPRLRLKIVSPSPRISRISRVALALPRSTSFARSCSFRIVALSLFRNYLRTHLLGHSDPASYKTFQVYSARASGSADVVRSYRPRGG